MAPRTLAALVVAAGCFSNACDDEASARALAPASAGPTATAAARSIDSATFCDRACERALDCGVEDANKIARSDAKEGTVVRATRSDPKVKASCVAECAEDASAHPEASTEALARAERCLEQASCTTFARCLSELH